jgi:hypothetical protein
MYTVKPGISISDNLYFREVFTDSPGIWNRAQSITPFLLHELSDRTAVGMEFKFQREWSPNRRMGTQIVRAQDRSLKVYYMYQYDGHNQWNNLLYYLSFERSYKLFGGDYNYLLFEALVKYSEELNSYIRYKGIINFQGNVTTQTSPLFFLGGHANLIGYDNDEFWGRRAFSTQHLLEFKPFPSFEFSVFRATFRRLAILCQLDIGQVRGAPVFMDLRPQTSDIRTGFGFGLGFNTDLPYMSATDMHIMAARPYDRSDYKFYAGFGGWLN